MPEGFELGSGAKIIDGAGVLLVGGEAFRWRPWLANPRRPLLDHNQWEAPDEAFGLLGLIWPRPGRPAFLLLRLVALAKMSTVLMCGADLLVLGTGADLHPVSGKVRGHVSSLGMRMEILGTRNAAALFNLLATERGVDNIAAALIPIGWKDRG